MSKVLAREHRHIFKNKNTSTKIDVVVIIPDKNGSI